jgi:hypothetical protein
VKSDIIFALAYKIQNSSELIEVKIIEEIIKYNKGDIKLEAKSFLDAQINL